MTTRLGTRVPDVSVNLGAAILSGGGSPPAPAATMPSTALYLSGTTGNYVSTPHSEDFWVTDFSLVTHIKPSDWSSGAEQYLVNRYTSIDGTNRTYGLTLSSTGALACRVSLDGNVSSIVNVSSSVTIESLGYTSADDLHVGCTYDVDSGSGDYLLRFWYSEDGTSWSQLGTDRTGTSLTPFNGTTRTLFGTFNGATGEFTGSVYSFAIYDGIGANTAPGQGTLVYEADFSHPWVGNRYTDSTGKVSTINGSAWAWEIPS